MQKKIIALAVAALASTAAFAQTNVTIYGIADVGVAGSFGGGQGGQANVISGGLSGSRIGFKGVEDLGNGLKALFTLEYSIDMDANLGVGAGTSAGARQQFVGLTGNFGTLIGGRLQTAGYDFACAAPIAGSALDPVAKLGVGAPTGAPNLLSCGSAGRASNAIAYVSPVFGGLTVALNHARVTEQAASSDLADTSATLVGLNYANGALNLGAVYSRVANKDDAAGLGAAADRVTEWGLRGSYGFSFANVFGSFQSYKVAEAQDNSSYKWTVGAGIPVSAKGTVVAQYAGNRLGNDGTKNGDSTALTLAYTHALSKRTTAYAGITHVINEKDANRAAGFQTVTAGKDPSVIALGLRHAF